MFFVSAVSAHENVTDDVVMINQNDKSTLEIDQNTGQIGNFTGLNDEISNIATGGNLTLKKDYVYCSNDSSFVDGIRITQDNIVIDGGGHTIDGAGQVRIFNITALNVTLKNINFVNGRAAENGGAIHSEGNGTVEHSTFNGNVAEFGGGAIYIDDDIKLNDCNFTDNSAKQNHGGSIFI